MQRNFHLDQMRVIACIMVIAIHVCNIYNRAFPDLPHTDYIIAALINAASRVSVPIFFMISGALSALGGGLLAARMQSSQPSSCEGLEFDAITAVVLGGVAMSGGVGTIGGMILGVFIMQCFNTGLIMAQVPVFWQTVARGLLLLFALIFDFYRRKNYEKKMLLQSIQVTEEAKKA